MRLHELENMLNVRFPQKFHEIYHTGAMEWMELSRSDISANREKWTDTPTAFLMLNCGCEPLLFEEIPEEIEHLKEWISWREDEEECSLAEGIRLIPFGHNAAHDLYCFLYEKSGGEPKVILYLHDDYDAPEIVGNTFSEFLYVQILDAAANEEDIDGAHWNAHLAYLDEAYRTLLEGKTPDDLTGEFDSYWIGEAKIFEY